MTLKGLRGRRSTTGRAERLLTPQEVANIAGVSADYVRDAIRRGELEGYVRRAGKGRRFGVERSVAEKWAEGKRMQKAEAA